MPYFAYERRSVVKCQSCGKIGAWCIERCGKKMTKFVRFEILDLKNILMVECKKVETGWKNLKLSFNQNSMHF